MKRCAITCTGRFQANRLSAEGQKRWASWEKSALTKEALLQQVESGLGHDAEGKPLRIDTDSKTVSTASGSLPISPIMDPKWMKSRRRERKAPPGKISGNFRRKLANNPFAEALMTPMRSCGNSKTTLPRYFYQDFELVDHPDPSIPHGWWAPGPLTFEDLVPFHNPHISKLRSRREKNVAEGEENVEDELPTEADAITETGTVEGTASQIRRPRRAPLTVYILARKKAIEILSEPDANRKLLSNLTATRHGMAMLSKGERRIWREGMDEVLLTKMRREAANTLIIRAQKSKAPEFKFIQPCSGWDDPKTLGVGGSVLWLPKEPQGEKSIYATLDIQSDWGIGGRTKLPVHDLTWLLGEEEVERLRKEAEMFQDKEVLLLKPWRSKSIRSLHLLLWKLQGYLADPQVDETAVPEAWPTTESKEKPMNNPMDKPMDKPLDKPKRESKFTW
ncbi:hypothetical protein CEP54_000167 [Fusarium duplospermum]|uniref:Uncharacterized protein n=1 Tax=Fusarium duplospermum TaxID=1325734 RepID=A0A428R8Q4_9HYPO|nr:hypothetical protein CEP54_000167 [Fusarium duplospermum]